MPSTQGLLTPVFGVKCFRYGDNTVKITEYYSGVAVAL